METNDLRSLLRARSIITPIMHMISRDGRFFALFRYEISHVTYRKFNTGISNELASQRERTTCIVPPVHIEVQRILLTWLQPKLPLLLSASMMLSTLKMTTR